MTNENKSDSLQTKVLKFELGGVTIFSYNGNPNGVVSASGGSLCINYSPEAISGGNIYQNIGSGTTWKNIAGDGQSFVSYNGVRDQKTVSGSAASGSLASGTVSGLAYDLQTTDVGKLIYLDNSTSGGGITIVIPANNQVFFEVGTQIDFQQLDSSGTCTFAPSFSQVVTILSKGGVRNLAEKYSAATIIQKSPNVWHLIGDLS